MEEKRDMRFLRGQNGFLMIEALIAVVIISVALGAIGIMFIQSTRANTSSVEITTATALAQKQMELLKGLPVSYWNALTPLPQPLPWQDSANPSMPITLNNVAFTVNTVAAASATDANMVQVSVTVSWRGQSIRLLSLFSKVDLKS